MAVVRGELTLGSIQRAAHQLALEEGLERVTMRRVAERVGVWPTAVYHHVGDKDGLLELVLDAVLAEVEVPSDDLAWQDWLRHFARSMREVLLRHPGVAGSLLDHPNVSPPALAVTERALGVLHRAGLSAPEAAEAFWSYFAYVVGRVRREERLASDGERGRARLSSTLAHPEVTSPLMRATFEHWLARTSEQVADEGLEILLAGIQARYLRS